MFPRSPAPYYLMFRFALLSLLSFGPMVSAAEAAGLLDRRLTDAETFARSADGSAPHSGDVLTPAATGRWTPAAAVRPPFLLRGLRTRRARGSVPADFLIQTADRREAGTRSELSRAGLALGSVGLLLLSAVFLDGFPTRAPAAQRPGRAALSPPLPQRSAPSLPHTDFRALTEPPRHPVADPRPGPSYSPYAISFEEQRAIEGWDRSLEKAQGRADLAQWLDLHAARLSGVDVPRLKAKLRRA